jgi:hypothetical protein
LREGYKLRLKFLVTKKWLIKWFEVEEINQFPEIVYIIFSVGFEDAAESIKDPDPTHLLSLHESQHV